MSDLSLRRSDRKRTPKKHFEESDSSSSDSDPSPSPTSSSISRRKARARAKEKQPSPNNKKRRLSSQQSTSNPALPSIFRGEFYAVRKGNGCEGCIFLKWDQAKPHVIGQNAEFSVFEKMEDAILYIQTPPQYSIGNNMKKRKRTATMPFTTGRTRKPAPPRHDLMLPSNDQPEENRRTKKRQSLTESEEEHEDEDNIPSMPVREDSRELTEILYEGYKQNKPKGWRPASLFVGDRQDRATWEFHYTQDLETLKNHRTNHGRMTREVHNPKHISGIPNAYSAAYLNWSWGVGEAYHRYLAFQKRRRYSRAASGEPARRRKTISTKIKSNPARNGDNQSASNRMCVITNREAAQKRFNARAMFISFRVQQLAELESNGIRKQDLPARPPKGHMHSQQSPLLNVSNRTREWMEEAREDYEKLSNEDIEYWRDQERKHDERQPEIITILQAALAKDPRRSAKKLMEDIGYWCGKTTIGKWKNMNKGTFHRRRDVPNAFVDAEEEDADEEEEDPTEEDEGDNDNGDDDDDDGSEEFEDEGDEEGEESPVGEEDLEKENLVNGRSKERRPPVREEKRQFLAKIPGASVNRKKDVDDSTQLPVRISVSTDKYIDTHVSALVCSPETNLTMNIAEEPTEEPTVCDEEHLVI